MSAPTVLQKASAFGHNVTSVSKAYTSTNTLGNTLVACLGGNGTSTPTYSIADTQLQTYSQLFITPSLSNAQVSVWLFPNCAAGANTITLTASVSADMNLDIFELAGCPTTGVNDNWSYADQSSTSVLIQPFSTSNATDLLLLYGYQVFGTTQTITIPGNPGFTSLLTNANTGGNELSFAYTYTTSATGTFGGFVNSTTNATFIGSIIAFSNNTVSTFAPLNLSSGSPNYTASSMELVSMGIFQGYQGGGFTPPIVPSTGQLYPQPILQQ